MSSIYFQALEVSASDLKQLAASGLSPSVRLSRTAKPCFANIGPPFRSTTILEGSRPKQLMLFAADIHVNHLAPHPEAKKQQQTCGQKCSASFDRSCQNTSSRKTFKKRRSPTRLNVSKALVTKQVKNVYRQLLRGLTIKEIVGGLLHTPTTKANFIAPSMQKWPSCRKYVAAFGGQPITPEQFEFLLGYPIGWTDLRPLEMPSCRKLHKSSDRQF